MTDNEVISFERYLPWNGYSGIRLDMIRVWADVYAHNPDSPLAYWRQENALVSIEFYLTHPR